MDIKTNKILLNMFKDLGCEDIEYDPKTYEVTTFGEGTHMVGQAESQKVLAELENLSQHNGWIKYVLDHFSVIPNTYILKNNAKVYFKKLFKKTVFKGKSLGDFDHDMLLSHISDICNPNYKYLFNDPSYPMDDKAMNIQRHNYLSSDIYKYDAIYAPSGSDVADMIYDNISQGETPGHQMYYSDGETIASMQKDLDKAVKEVQK